MSGDGSVGTYESLIDATLLRFRDFDRVRPPEAEALSPSDRMVTLCPRWDVDSDDVLDRVPNVRSWCGGAQGVARSQAVHRPALIARRRYSSFRTSTATIPARRAASSPMSVSS